MIYECLSMRPPTETCSEFESSRGRWPTSAGITGRPPGSPPYARRAVRQALGARQRPAECEQLRVATTPCASVDKRAAHRGRQRADNVYWDGSHQLQPALQPCQRCV